MATTIRMSDQVYQDLRNFIQVKSENVRATEEIPDYAGITPNDTVAHLLKIARKYYKLE